jgi:AmiR/NasT family two-component response regulator
MTDKKTRALIVEDEFLIAESLKAQLENIGYDVCGIAATADKAVALAIEHEPDFVLMDVRLDGEKDGVDAALAIHGLVDTAVIFLTGSREQATVDRIAMDHAAATLFKPISSIQLKRTVVSLIG